MATRKDVLAGLSGLGTGFSKMGSMMMERERMDTQTALEQEESERRKAEEGRRAALHGPAVEAATAGATQAKTLASEALAVAEKRKGLDAFNQERLAENEAAGWVVDPEDQGQVSELKAQLKRLNAIQNANGKQITTPGEFYQEYKDTKLGRTSKANDETRAGQKHASDLETDKSQRRLLGANADKAEREAKVGPGKPPTESQSNSALFGRRLELASRDMEEIAAGGHDASSVAAGVQRTLSKMPGGNMVVGDNAQRQRNAETNFLTAVLRKESGASISPTEFSTGEQLYFERTGDSDAVKQQKARNREQALLGFKAAAGSAWENVQLTPPGEKPKGKLEDLSDDDLDTQLRAKGIDPATGRRIAKGGASGAF